MTTAAISGNLGFCKPPPPPGPVLNSPAAAPNPHGNSTWEMNLHPPFMLNGMHSHSSLLHSWPTDAAFLPHRCCNHLKPLTAAATQACSYLSLHALARNPAHPPQRSQTRASAVDVDVQHSSCIQPSLTTHSCCYACLLLSLTVCTSLPSHCQLLLRKCQTSATIPCRMLPPSHPCAWTPSQQHTPSFPVLCCRCSASPVLGAR